jgi:uncharacterized repeat protein (TIGR01451 family)
MVLASALWSGGAQAQASFLFLEDFGSTDGQLPTAQSTADGSWLLASCLNGFVSPGGQVDTGGSGSTHLLHHNTDTCPYTVGEAVWRSIDPIPVESNRTYIFSYWSARLNTVSDPVLSQAVVPNGGGSISVIETLDPAWPAPATWLRRHVIFRTGAGTTSVNLRIHNANTVVNGNDFVLDDVLLATMPTVTLNKVTEGSPGGPFGFTLTNTMTATGSVTTAAAGTPTVVDGDPDAAITDFTASALDTAITITESSLPSGWELSDATCTNSGGAQVGSLAGTTYTIPASAVVFGETFSCTATNTGEGEADLSITKDDGQTAYTPGGTVIYEIVVTNVGPSDVLGAQISDPMPSGIADASWTCADDGSGSACGAANGTGAIATTADLPAGSSVTYTLSMTVPIGFNGDLTNTATVDVPVGMTDVDPSNNMASDTDTQFTSPPGPDPSVCNIATNGSFESPDIQNDPEGPGDNTAFVNGFAVWRTTTNPISGWETAAGTIDILRHFNNASEGLQSIDLWGTAAATIRQTFTGLVPGAQYTFSVDYSGLSAANSIAVVQLGNGVGATPVTLATLQPAADGVSNGNAGIPTTPSFSVIWSTYQHTFTAVGTEATVQFVNNTTPADLNTGLFVDNFSFAGDPCADLAIVKTVAPDGATTGDEVVYTLQVTNDGPDPADGALVTDPGVPGSLECTALACSADGGAACPAGPTPAQLAAGLAIPTFPVGGTVTLELTCTVTATGL